MQRKYVIAISLTAITLSMIQNVEAFGGRPDGRPSPQGSHPSQGAQRQAAAPTPKAAPQPRAPHNTPPRAAPQPQPSHHAAPQQRAPRAAPHQISPRAAPQPQTPRAAQHHISPQAVHSQNTPRVPHHAPVQPQTIHTPHPAAPAIAPKGPSQVQSQALQHHLNRNAARTPSLSRSDRGTIFPGPTHPSIPSHPIQEKAKPGSPQTSIDKATSLPPRSREQVRQYIEKTKQWGAGRQTSPQRNEAVKAALPERIKKDRERARQVGERVERDHPNHRQWFSDEFFQRHHYTPEYYHHRHDWWRRADWQNISVWLGWGTGVPAYYYDEGYPVELPSNFIPPPDEMYPPAPQGIDTGAVLGDWLPLGVFAAGTDSEQAAYSNMVVQLAVSGEGFIGGTYYNATTDQTRQIEGSIDKETQQAVWKLSDNPDSPVMTTGVYNLTQDVVPVQVHFQDNFEQPWVLVRLPPDQQ